MAYEFIENASCKYKPDRHLWTALGRTSASQSSHAIDEFGRAFGWGQNYNYQSGVGDFQYISYGNYGRPDLYEIELATQISVPGKCIKICSGELSSLAINEDGELYGWGIAEGATGDNCASFALPHDSGLGRKGWMGIPDPNKQYYFPTPTRVAPGYYFKDIAFDYYHALAVGKDDDRLYVWGYDDGYGSLGLGPGIGSVNTPTLNPYITDKIKFIDCELFCSGAVTENDEVYIWSEWWWYTQASWWTWDVLYPLKITGLVIPVGETITYFSVSPDGVYVVLSNGELWAAGNSYLFMDQEVAYPTGTATFKRVTALDPRKIVLARTTALGSEAGCVIDEDGNIWGWSDGPDYFTGNGTSPTWNVPNLVAASFEGQRKYIDVIFNEHNLAYSAIDEDGWLYTWGSQSWGTHLATNTAYSQADIDRDPNIEGIVKLQTNAGLAKQAVDSGGNQTLLNYIYVPESLYIQPIPQDQHHWPCGHWHLREWDYEERSNYPANCWMPSLALDGGTLLFVAAGRRMHSTPGWEDTGNEVMMFLHDIDANTWTELLWDELIHTANYPGGAALHGSVAAFMNYKYDVSGTVFNEVYTNPAMGVWVIDSGTLEYTEFASESDLSGIDKIGVHSSGLVAIAYENVAGQLLVQVSTDSGATWALRKTIAVLAARKGYSLVVDENGYIYLAHQITSSAVMIERSIDNGVSWTTQAASNSLISNLIDLKLSYENGKLFLFGMSTGYGAIEYSINSGVTWYSISSEPGPSIRADGSTVVDGGNNLVLAEAYDTIYNYELDGVYQWKESTIDTAVFEGTTITAVVDNQENATMVSSAGRFAYASYAFYSVPDGHVAVLISNNSGQNWFFHGTPLGFRFAGTDDLSTFDGCPLFQITDVPHLNHIWSFEKSSWAEDFVKQKDKYEHVAVCQPHICVKGE